MNRIALALALIALPALADEAEKKAPAAPPPSAAGEDNEVVARATCKRENDERVLEVIPKEKGCVLHYTKGGKTQEMAHSSRGVQICQDALAKIQKRLEVASYKCE